MTNADHDLVRNTLEELGECVQKTQQQLHTQAQVIAAYQSEQWYQRKLLERLRAFSQHRASCHCNDDTDTTCTCGYTLLLAQIEKA